VLLGTVTAGSYIHHVPARILVVDDDSDMCDVLASELKTCGFDVRIEQTADAALLAAAQTDFDVVITDLQMPEVSGAQLCARMSVNRPDVPVIVVTAFGSMDTAIAAIRAGAYDFLPKPFPPEQLTLIVERAVRHRSMRQEIARLRDRVALAGRRRDAGGILGDSLPMRELFDLIDRVSDSETSILVTGESGTGKELVARQLHAQGRRARQRFVAINCAAVPQTLLESELFGHVKGAFTDARTDRKGLFVEADGGTLLLDEVGDMPPGFQPKLLRVLQDRRVRPIGSDRETDVDVRIIAATNHDLEDDVAQGRFREDLYFRLNVIRLRVPPLRARGADILELAHHFLLRFADDSGKPVREIAGPAAERLLGYGWPGNVRELENCIQRAVALARFEHIVVDDLPEKIRDYHIAQVIPRTDDPAELVPIDEVERRYILRVLDVVGGNKSQAARILGYDRKTLYRRMSKYGIAPDTAPPAAVASSG
jgi:two-component system response regulator HydG